MFGTHEKKNELALPPIAGADPNAVEVLRVWASPGNPQQVTLRTTWKDYGAWGLLLVDIAKHAANAYANEGADPAVVLARIRELFDVEWTSRTDEPQDVSS